MYCEGCLVRVLSRCYPAILPHIFQLSMISINCLLLFKLVIDFEPSLCCVEVSVMFTRVPQSSCCAWMRQTPSWRIGWWTCLRGRSRNTTTIRSTSYDSWPHTGRATWRITLSSATLRSWTSALCTWVTPEAGLHPVCGKVSWIDLYVQLSAP